MNQEELPKGVKRKLNEFAARAHTEVMRQALEKLGEDFDHFRRGEIDPFELESRIHKFHDGPAREIYNRWATRRDF